MSLRLATLYWGLPCGFSSLYCHFISSPSLPRAATYSSFRLKLSGDACTLVLLHVLSGRDIIHTYAAYQVTACILY